MIMLSIITILLGNLVEEKTNLLLLPIMIALMRLQADCVGNFGYHINQALFPVLVRGQAYGIVNFFSRPFAAGGTILVEYTS
jgi:hypothetical protein